MFRRYVPELDGLRALACLGVLVAHYNPVVLHQSTLVQIVRDSSPGNIGVMLFFALSGYLVTSLAVREWHKRGTFEPQRFMIRRALRIWPMYYVYITIAMIALTGWPFFGPLIGLDESLGTVLRALPFYLLFVGNWIEQPLGELGILWTLCVEMQFYFVFGLVFYGATKLPLIRGAAIPFFVALAFALRYLLPQVIDFSVQIYYLTFTYIDTFAFGAAAAVISSRSVELPAAVVRVAKSPWAGIVAVLTLSCLGYFGRHLWWPPYGPETTIYYGGLSLCCGLIVLWTVLNSGAQILSWLRHDIVRSLGVLSYGTYLFHVLCERWLNVLQGNAGLTNVEDALAYYIGFLGYAGGSYAMSAIGFVLIETRGLFLRSRLFGEKTDSKRWDVAWGKILAGGFFLALLAAVSLRGTQ